MAKVYVIAGLGFGDEGKGSLVDFLCRQTPPPVVVRYNGGAQAAHNVVEPDGRHHTFAQFGSGTLAGAATYLSRYVKVNPLFLETEAKHLVEVGVERPQDLLRIDGTALVTNPYQVAANRLRELLRIQRHGSCGMGVGETVADRINFPDDAIRVHHLNDPDTLFKLLSRCRTRKQDEFDPDSIDTEARDREYQVLHDPHLLDEVIQRYLSFSKSYEIVSESYLDGLLQKSIDLVFEGAQGVLLDEDYGFHPYTTWSHTTFRNAKTLLNRYPARYIGLLRCYHTRHGAGPFPTETPNLGYATLDHNGYGPWQQGFRLGHFDLPLTRYALRACPCDELAITCLDQVQGPFTVCASYEEGEIRTPKSIPDQERNTQFLQTATPKYEVVDDLVKHLENRLRLPVSLTSHGPTWSQKQCR